MAWEKLLFLGKIARISPFACNPVKDQLRQSSALFKSISHWQPCCWQAFRSLATGTPSLPKIKQHSRTPYIIFASDKMAALIQANPGVRVPDLGRMLGQMWRLLSEQEKEVYKLRYLEEKDIFIEEKKARMESMSEEEKLKIAEDKRLRRRQRHIRRIKKLRKEFGKPMPGDTNPYVLFVKLKCLERGDAPFNQYMQGVSAFWKKMPEDDKQPFIDEARENSVKYRKELAEWEKKMIAEGHQNLVCKSHLRKKRISRPRMLSKVVAKKSKPSNKRRAKKNAQTSTVVNEELTTTSKSPKKVTSTGPGKKSKKTQTEE